MFSFLCECGITVLLFLQVSKADPCSSYTLLKDQYRRSSGHVLQPTDDSISDNFLTEGWYRFVSGAGNDMVTFATSIRQCGAVFPIWMNGTLPLDSDGEVTRTACIVGVGKPCERTLSIKVKSCGGYRVYYLVPPPQAAAGYCIGEKSKCFAGQISDTGFTPCYAYTPTNVRPAVNASLEYFTLDTGLYGPIAAVFKCLFAEPPGGPHWYDTYWYINNDEVKVVEARPYQDNQSWLYPKDWVHTYNMNMVVKCAIRARESERGDPGHFNHSKDFPAGMFPSSYNYHVLEGNTTTIEFKVTVPVGCMDRYLMSLCNTRIYIETPEYQSSIDACQNFSGQGGLSFEKYACGIVINSFKWWETKILKVIGKTDGLINSKNRVVNIRLRAKENSVEDTSGVWFNFTMPTIKVNIQDEDKKIANKLCYASTDPRMGTFDNKYWTAQKIGEFIMYRDVKRNIAVHALFSSCYWGRIIPGGEGPCGCGVAVRVEDSLFVYRTCGEISYRYFKSLVHHSTLYHICDNRNMVIESKKDSWTHITLPTGATVKFQVGEHKTGDFLYHIYITPSIFDEDNVEGLCGNPNNNKTDDFIPRHSTSPISDKNDFQSSWGVDISSPESLFGPNVQLNEYKNFKLERYCDCATVKSNINSSDVLKNHYTAECFATPALLCPHEVDSDIFKTTCPRSESRYKRDSNMDSSHQILKRSADPDDVIDIPPLTLDPLFDPDFQPPTPQWKNGWTEATARALCENAILNDPARLECQKYIPIENNTNSSIEDCVLDIRDTGTTNFLNYTVDSLKQFCFGQIKLHEIFYTTDDSLLKSVVETIGELVCPNNCTANGICKSGICICTDFFIGVDCSHTKSLPPVNTSLPENGLCRTSQRPCTKTNIYGHFLSQTVHVKFKFFKITEEGKSPILSMYTTNATYIGPTVLKVVFPTSLRKKRSLFDNMFGMGFDISLSYDEVNYGDAMSIVIFNDECFSCKATTLQCNQTKPCPETTQATKTTQQQEILEQNESKEIDFMVPLVIGLCILFAIILIVFGVFLYKKKRVHVPVKPCLTSIGADSNSVDCSKPPILRYETLKYDELSSPSPYEILNTVAKSDIVPPSKYRPQSASGISMKLDWNTNME